MLWAFVFHNYYTCSFIYAIGSCQVGLAQVGVTHTFDTDTNEEIVCDGIIGKSELH